MIFGNTFAPFRVVMIPETSRFDVIILPVVVYSVVVHKLVDVMAQPAYGCRVGKIKQIRLGALASVHKPLFRQFLTPT